VWIQSRASARGKHSGGLNNSTFLLAWPASAQSTSAKQELADEGIPQGHVAANTSVCLARTWKDCRRAQCGKRIQANREFCGRRDTDHKRSMGRIDGPIPENKRKEFERARAKREGVKCEQPDTHIAQPVIHRGGEETPRGVPSSAAGSVAALRQPVVKGEQPDTHSAQPVFPCGGEDTRGEASSSAADSAAAPRQPIHTLYLNGPRLLLRGDAQPQIDLERRLVLRGSMGRIHSQAQMLDAHFMRDMQEPMRKSLEDDEFFRACAENLEVNVEARARIKEEEAIMTERLRELGLARVEMVSNGNCQFAAIVRAAGLAMLPEAFRAIICDAMEATGL